MKNIKLFEEFINEKPINEGTRSQFGKIDKKGNISSVYIHYDGYPENMKSIIMKGYKNVKNVDKVISKGGASSLETSPAKMRFYNDAASDATTGYNAKDMFRYLNDMENDAGAEYVYLYDERDGKWKMSSYGERELVDL